MRESERTPVGKLYKRSFRPLIDRLQRPVTWPLACGFQLSTFLWNMLTEYFKLCPSADWKPILRDFKTYFAIEMSLNKAQTLHGKLQWCQTLQSKRSICRKQKGECTDVTNRIYRSSHTISHFTVLLGFLVRIPIAVAATAIVSNCSAWSFIYGLES